MADDTADEERRAKIFDLMLTAPPFAEWPQEFVEQLSDLANEVCNRHRERERRQLEEMYDATADDEAG